MDKIPKSIINKFEKCHKYQSKSNKFYGEIQEWFVRTYGEECTHGEFYLLMNDIQGGGLDERNLEGLLDDIHDALLEEEWKKKQENITSTINHSE